MREQPPCEDAYWLSSFVGVMGTTDWKETLDRLVELNIPVGLTVLFVPLEEFVEPVSEDIWVLLLSLLHQTL